MTDILNNIAEGLKAMSNLEWYATIFGIIYLILAIKNKVWCFLFGIIGSAIWAYVSFYSYGLLYDALLNAFYVAMSVYGWYMWGKGGDDNDQKPITDYPINTHFLIIGGGMVLSVILAFVSKNIEGLNYVGLDAFTTVFLVIGTVMLVYRKLSSWIYLVIADLVYIYVYWKVSAYLFVLMMIIYVIFGIVGYFQWKKEIQTQKLQ